MDISRRGFLVGSLGAFLATTIPGSLVAREYEDKIAKLIVLYDDIVEYNTSEPDTIIMSKKFNDIIHFMNNNFKSSKTSENNLDKEELREVSKMMYDSVFSDRWHEIPPVMKEELIPVAVVILLLKSHRIELGPTAFKEPFEIFEERYYCVIVNA